jgi:hypothetical protein
MIQFSIIFWAQLSLVAMGASMQLAAFLTFTREPHLHGGVQQGLHDSDEDEPHHESETPPSAAPLASLYHPRPANPSGDNSMSELDPGKLLKTAKVCFKQRFEGLK